MGDSPNMLKLSLIFSVFLLGTLVIGTSAHKCSEECEAKNGTCFWKPPPRNSGYRKVGLCSVGQKGEGQVGSCGKSKKCRGSCLARGSIGGQVWCNKKDGCVC